RTVAGEYTMRRDALYFVLRKTLGLQLRPRFSKRAAFHQSFRLGKTIGQQHFMLMIKFGFMPVSGHDKFQRNSICTLMQKLEESMLTIGAGLAPTYGSGRAGNRLAIHRHAFAV